MEIFSDFKSLDLICEYLIKTSLVLLISLLLIYLFRNKSAALKHFILSSSLIGLLLFPLLSSFSIGWETQLLPLWSSEHNNSSMINKASYENTASGINTSFAVIGLARPSYTLDSNETTFAKQHFLPGQSQQKIQEKKIEAQEKKQQKELEEAQEKKLKEKKKIKWISKDGKRTILIDKDGMDNWTISGDKLELHNSKDGKGNKIIYLTPHIKEHGDIHLKLNLEHLEEKIQKIQKKVQKITQEKVTEALAEIETDKLKEVEEALAQISEELAQKSDILKDMHISVDPDIHIDIHKEIEEKIHKEIEKKIHNRLKDHDVLHIKELKEIDAIENKHKEDKVIVGVKNEGETISIKFKTTLNKNHKLEYGEALEKLKKELPEGYEVESEFEEEGNTFTIIITGESKDKEEKRTVKNLIKKISEELKKFKDKKK